MNRPALTVWQPWATLIVRGVKPFEFRGYPAPKRLIGRRIVIHAGKRKPVPEELIDVAMRPERSCGANATFDTIAKIADEGMPLGAAVGEVTLGTPVLAVEEPTLQALAEEHGYALDELNPDLWAWPMLEPLEWTLSIPCGGRQGFWDFVPVIGVDIGATEKA